MSEIEEIAVVGSCMVDPSALRVAIEILEPEHFADPKLSMIFRVMKRLSKEGIAVDTVTLQGHMTPQEILESGGLPYFMDIVDKVPTALHIEHYARLVRSSFFRREIVKLCDQMKSDPKETKIRKQMRDCWDEIDGVGALIINSDTGLFEWNDTLESRGRAGRSNFRTGFRRFDYLTGGVNKGDLVTFGARTSRGKTSMLISVALKYILEGSHRVLFVTAEMTGFQIMDRMVSILSGVPLSSIRNGVKEDEQSEISRALESLHKKPFFIADLPRLTMPKIYEAIQNTRPDIVMIDYIQRFTVPDKTQNRAAYFSDVANNLKYLAKHRNIAIFASSQLNRGMEFSKDREPSLADLKESGGIEEASDLVVLIHSPTDGVNGMRDVDMIVAKNRNGMLGKIPFYFVEFTTAFMEGEVAPESDPVAESPAPPKSTRFNEGKRKDLFQ